MKIFGYNIKLNIFKEDDYQPVYVRYRTTKGPKPRIANVTWRKPLDWDSGTWVIYRRVQ